MKYYIQYIEFNKPAYMSKPLPISNWNGHCDKEHAMGFTLNTARNIFRKQEKYRSIYSHSIHQNSFQIKPIDS